MKKLAVSNVNTSILMSGVKFIVVVVSTLFFSCYHSNILTYNNKRFCEEKNSIRYDSSSTIFIQSVIYRHPRMYHGYVHILTLKILDTTAAKLKSSIDLLADSAIVIPQYKESDRWREISFRPNGQFKILEWTSEKIVIKEKITMIDTVKNRRRTCIGKRTFVK